MRAISLIQPWATLWVIGAARGGKGTETRSWSTPYRGPLWVHASKAWPPWARELCMRPPFADALRAAGYGTGWLPTGVIVGRVEVVDCLRIGSPADVPPEPERSFGDYSPGRYAWISRDPLELPTPVPCRGALGLWEVPPDVAAKIEEQVRRRCE